MKQGPASSTREWVPDRFARTRRERPEPLPRSLWGWIPKVLQYTQDDVVELAGYDAAMYLRILAFGIAPSFWMFMDGGHNITVSNRNCGIKMAPGLRKRWHAGIELFTFVSLWVIIVVLPTNLSVRPHL